MENSIPNDESQMKKIIGDELAELNISNNFKKRIADKRNYKLDLFGDMGVYKTPYYRV